MKLKEICDKYGLNYTSWLVLTQASLFQTELARLQEEHLERTLDDADTPMLELAMASSKAAKTLVDELENHDFENDRATSQTRIKAAAEVLDRLGYGNKQQGAVANIINITLSPSKVEFFSQRLKAV